MTVSPAPVLRITLPARRQDYSHSQQLHHLDDFPPDVGRWLLALPTTISPQAEAAPFHLPLLTEVLQP